MVGTFKREIISNTNLLLPLKTVVYMLNRTPFKVVLKTPFMR
jgi:hypothetical protein